MRNPKKFMLSLPEPAYDPIKNEADRRGWTVQDMIRYIVDAWCERRRDKN